MKTSASPNTLWEINVVGMLLYENGSLKEAVAKRGLPVEKITGYRRRSDLRPLLIQTPLTQEEFEKIHPDIWAVQINHQSIIRDMEFSYDDAVMLQRLSGEIDKPGK